MQLSAVGLFKYVWPFSEHQALKGQISKKDYCCQCQNFHLSQAFQFFNPTIDYLFRFNSNNTRWFIVKWSWFYFLYLGVSVYQSQSFLFFLLLIFVSLGPLIVKFEQISFCIFFYCILWILILPVENRIWKFYKLIKKYHLI